jgi:CHAD domain-containing protein
MLHHLGTAIAARADALIRHLPGAIAGDAEDAHRTRVASRRLGEVLPLLEGRKAERARTDVREVRQMLGARRELVVTEALLTEEALRWHWPAPLVARVARALAATRPAIEAAVAEQVRRLDIDRLRRRLARMAAQAVDESDADITARLRARRVARERSLARAITRAGRLYDVERLHDVRICTKKLRYVLEAQVECTGRGPRQRLKHLKRLQEELGRLHDLQVLEAAVRRVEEGFVAGRGRVARGLRRMGDDLEGDCRRLHAQVLTLVGE